MLFPDRRDFLVLTPFPVRLRELFGAKLAALGLFLLAATLAVNAVPVLLLPVFSAYVKQAKAAGVLRLMLAQLVSTGAAALFGFFLVAAFQGLLINVTSPRVFRRISPWIQMCGMSVMVLSLMLFPVYSMVMRPVAQQHPDWLYYFPPYWFAGIYDQILPRPDPQFVALGRFGWQALGAAIATFCITWRLGFRRHYRQTLESGETAMPPASQRDGLTWTWLLRTPEERAIFYFSGTTIARSLKHRLFLATYLSVGVSFGLLVTVIMKGGKLSVSDDGLRSMPLLITFFVISGLRAAFQFPADLLANWTFRMAEDGWGETSRRATPKTSAGKRFAALSAGLPACRSRCLGNSGWPLPLRLPVRRRRAADRTALPEFRQGAVRVFLFSGSFEPCDTRWFLPLRLHQLQFHDGGSGIRSRRPAVEGCAVLRRVGHGPDCGLAAPHPCRACPL